MKPPLAYRVVRFEGRFYPQYQRKSWLSWLGCGPVWCLYAGDREYWSEEEATTFVAKEREVWARVKLPFAVVREIPM